jgi:uncharacterized membrane protein
LDKRVEKADRQKRLVAALSYLFTPLIPLLVLVTDMGHDPYLRRHAARALVSAPVMLAGLALMIVVMVLLLRQSFLWVCLLPIVMLVPFIPAAIWGRRVYLYGDVRPPIITAVADRLILDRPR